MLSQKSGLRNFTSQTSKNKCSKPYSFLSIGLSKMPGSQPHFRNWQKSEYIPHNKVETNKRNNENLDSKSVVPFSTNLQQAKKYSDPHLTQNQIHLSTFQKVGGQIEKGVNEDVIFSHQKLTFQNITNQMMVQSSDKAELFEKENKNSLNQVKENNSIGKCEHLVINLKKKIKKLEKSKHILCQKSKLSALPMGQTQIQSQSQLQIVDTRSLIVEAHSQYLQNPCSDYEVYPDSSIFRSKIINQRIDNDVDSDDEQIQAGIRRLHKYLSDHVKDNIQEINQHFS